ncbi:serine protease gd isoform X1 [Anoplolepis gracilipes]
MMSKIPILIALLSQLLYTLPEVFGQQSSCSQYFTYIIEPTTNEVMGQIQISSPPKNVELHLKVALSIAVALSTNYVGELELAESKEESVRIVQQGGPLLYHIHFPLRQPIPLLTGLWFNNQQYCSGPRAAGQIVTSIILEHILYPPNALPLSQSSDPNNSPQQNPHTGLRPDISLPVLQPAPVPVYTTRPPIIYTTSRPPNQSLTTVPKKKSTSPRPTTVNFSNEIGNNPFLNPPQQNNNNECGVISHTNDINLLISNGIKTAPGQWPWLAALFIVKLEFEFQCAGSILTNRHVLTAAHCLKLDTSQNNIPPSVLLVSLGRYQLRNWHEQGSVNREISNYILHPDYLHQGSGDSDLAILILRTSVEFSPTIRPICLWYDSIDLQRVVNKTGYVVGWGRDEFGSLYTAEPRITNVPIVSQEECLWSDARFVSFTSNRTFCAGLRDGSGPCNGDSGSGLVLHNPATGRYQLRGIVSRSLFDREKLTCDLTKYVVFVDVAKFMPWITQQIFT